MGALAASLARVARGGWADAGAHDHLHGPVSDSPECTNVAIAGPLDSDESRAIPIAATSDSDESRGVPIAATSDSDESIPCPISTDSDSAECLACPASTDVLLQPAPPCRRPRAPSLPRPR